LGESPRIETGDNITNLFPSRTPPFSRRGRPERLNPSANPDGGPCRLRIQQDGVLTVIDITASIVLRAGLQPCGCLIVSKNREYGISTLGQCA
jgi:hypothetical protein